jgi:catechol 2,3-dioxygenase-like lactoylglutathione lyase family enzyme
MKINRIDHVGVIVNDLSAAKAFFLDFGLVLQGEGELEGECVDRVVGLTALNQQLPLADARRWGKFRTNQVLQAVR